MRPVQIGQGVGFIIGENMNKKFNCWKKYFLGLMDKGNKRSIFGSEVEAYKGIEKIRKMLYEN